MWRVYPQATRERRSETRWGDTVGSSDKQKRSLASLLWRHWAWTIVGFLMVLSVSTGWRAYRIGFPEAMPLVPVIGTYVVVMALVLSIKYVVIKSLSRGIKQGMSDPPASRPASKTDEVAETVGRTTGRYVGLAGRAVSKSTKKARRIAKASARAAKTGLAATGDERDS